MSDIVVSHRYRPGNTGDVGQGLRTDFTSTSSAAVAIPNRSTAAYENNPEVYIDFYCSAACHIVFGGASVGAATNNDPIFVPAFGYVSMMLRAQDTHFRIKGNAGSGTAWIWFSGC